MIAITTLIMIKRIEYSTATTKAEANKIDKTVRWLEDVAAIAGDEVMVSKTAVIAAADWVSPEGYAESLTKRDGRK